MHSIYFGHSFWSTHMQTTLHWHCSKLVNIFIHVTCPAMLKLVSTEILFVQQWSTIWFCANMHVNYSRRGFKTWFWALSLLNDLERQKSDFIIKIVINDWIKIKNYYFVCVGPSSNITWSPCVVWSVVWTPALCGLWQGAVVSYVSD